MYHNKKTQKTKPKQAVKTLEMDRNKRYKKILMIVEQRKVKKTNKQQIYILQQTPMESVIVVVALINGMIGGVILVLPLLAKDAGTLQSALVIMATGFFSFYSCYLCLKHLSNNKDLDQTLLQHFNQNPIVKMLYDALIFVNMLFVLMLYFQLIIDQWVGLLYLGGGDSVSTGEVINTFANAIFVVFLTIALSYLHLGVKILGFGILSIMGYCVFLIWLVCASPPGPNKIPLFGDGAVTLAASMGQAFSIQSFFLPVLYESKNRNNYSLYLLCAFLIGGSTYLFIAIAGSYGIANRTIQWQSSSITIQNYFGPDQWQVKILQVIYLIHLYSAFGEFLLVCKKRFFSLFNLPQTHKQELVNIKQLLFIVILIGVTVVVNLTGLSIDVIIELNGGVVGFFYVYLLPAGLHFKCLYYNNNDKIILPLMNEQKPILYQQTQIKKNREIQLQNPNLNYPQSLPDLNIIGKQRQISQSSQIDKFVNRGSNVNQSGLLLNQQLEKNKQPQKQPTQKSYQQQRKLSQQPEQVHEVHHSRYNSDNHNELLLASKSNTCSDINAPLIVKYNQTNCICDCKKPILPLQILEIILMIGMVGLGFFIMVDAIYVVAHPQSS